jgi:hypothetical protein
MNPTSFPATILRSNQRIKLAIQALSGTANISHLAAEHHVSRKYIYQQKDKALAVLDDAFAPTTADETVLFYLPVTKRWLHQLILCLTLICHSSFRGVVEFMRDMLGVFISEGTVHNVHQVAIQRAGANNRAQDLSPIREALLDEIFHCDQPVLVGVDARSTYCFLLAAESHRDAETWAIHHLYAKDQGFNPDYTVADGGTGLRAGQKLVWNDTPCHGDIFHIQHQCEVLANTLSSVAKGCISARQKLQIQAGNSAQVSAAIHAETQSNALARDVRTLSQWLGHDILSLAGPPQPIRQELFDFVIAELAAREPLDERRIRPVRIALQNQRDDLLAFAGVLDEKLDDLARDHHLSPYLVRQVCVLQRKPDTSPAYWESWCRLCAQIGHQCHAVFAAVIEAMAQTPRCSSMVENLNSRLRNYFTLRRQLGGDYLSLLQFFLNHRVFLRSRIPERVGKSPTQLMTGNAHPHWLTLLGFGLPQPLPA